MRERDRRAALASALLLAGLGACISLPGGDRPPDALYSLRPPATFPGLGPGRLPWTLVVDDRAPRADSIPTGSRSARRRRVRGDLSHGRRQGAAGQRQARRPADPGARPGGGRLADLRRQPQGGERRPPRTSSRPTTRPSPPSSPTSSPGPSTPHQEPPDDPQVLARRPGETPAIRPGQTDAAAAHIQYAFDAPASARGWWRSSSHGVSSHRCRHSVQRSDKEEQEPSPGRSVTTGEKG
jgi:hypothetical protein